mgnify:CR=1 FL=1
MYKEADRPIQPRHWLTLVLRLVKYLFLLLMSLFVILPFVWMILTSLMPDARALLLRPFRLPWPPNFSNYVEAMKMQPFGIYAFNSVFISTVVTILSVITAMLAGYAFAFLKFPFRRTLFMLVLMVLMMPGQVSIISLYVTMSKLNWLDTYWALIVPFVADAYGIYLIKQNFESIPIDFVESAKMEGAGHIRILFQILMHLAKPSLIAYGIMSFKWRWNDYFWVLMMTSSEEVRTLPVGLVMMKVEDGGNQWHLIMAATLMVILPIIVIYLLVQKGFAKNQLAGGIKG